ncbi:MAG: benzoyl-CoA-dihydrodiol lyase, partial [Acidimicrobiaceae bacterium]|nr:benzoyl-CoA-dihydrodiol lyase [Acidimicrobiaceae bacterium]
MGIPVAFETHPDHYRHWSLRIDGPVATLSLRVSPDGGLSPGYELKLNSYDLSVDIELCDACQRLRFEHPEVKAVVVTGGLEKVFCAGANIQMLAGATHDHKVNFCKFTNETRNAMEDASAHSGQVWLAAVNGTAAGGGYELALACEEIMLVDDGASTVSLPEVPLLAVLPGTGGLTRLVDKRHVRRDLADVFCTRAEGVKGKQAVEWGLVDAVAPRSGFDDLVRGRAEARAATSDRPASGSGLMLQPLGETQWVSVEVDRSLRAAHVTVRGPTTPSPLDGLTSDSWLLAACRELDDAILRLRFNEPEIGTWVLHTSGDPSTVLEAESLLGEHPDHWLVREMRLYWARTLRRLDVSARTVVALVEPGSCFAGVLAELALAADRSFMLDDPSVHLELSSANDGWVPMSNGLSRLEARFWGRPDALAAARSSLGVSLPPSSAFELGLVTFAPDDLDWDDEVRLVLEERASFSADALTAMEANLRFVGPETMETKVFSR